MHELQYLEASSGPDPDAAIIWLHGLGADGYDFLPIIEQLDLPSNCKVHFLFPHAPVQPVSINQGISMNAWFDIHQLTLHAEEDEQGIFKSMHSLEALITSKFSHIDPNRILLAGFSQGGALTLHTLLHGNIAFGGAIALSSYLPLRKLVAQARYNQLQQTEIFMAHGTSDEILPHEIGVLSKDVLLKIGAHVEWHEYAMGHELCKTLIQDLRAWTLRRLGE